MKNLNVNDPEPVVDNWEYVNFDILILYEDYVNMDKNVVICGVSTDVDNIAQVAVKDVADDGLKKTRKYNRNIYLMRRRLWCIQMNFNFFRRSF